MTQPSVPRPCSDRGELEQLHQRLSRSIDDALAQPPPQFARHFHAIVALAETDFRREEALMETFACADRSLHREQHARMLAGLHHAAAALDQGDPAPAAQALDALRQWLVFHGATLDRHLQRQLDRTAPGHNTRP